MGIGDVLSSKDEIENGRRAFLSPHHSRPRLIRNAPDEVLTPNPGCLDGGADQTAASEPDTPSRAHDAQSQSERNAEVSVAIRGHVRKHLEPSLVTVF